MKLWQKLSEYNPFKRKQPEAIKASGKRAFEGAKINRLTGDWLATGNSADSELLDGLKNLRNRARDLERNSPYAQRYLDALENNTIGHNGIQLQMRVVNLPSGLPDKSANDRIEQGWERWCRQVGFHQICKNVVRSTARDGAVLVRKLKGTPNTDNEFGFGLLPLEIDHLDTDYNGQYNGNWVRLGSEFDESGKVVAYHILTRHPGEWIQSTPQNRPTYRVRIPADEVYHIFRQQRFGQSTGVSWFAPVMLSLQMLQGYQEATLVAARTGACQMGFMLPKAAESYQGDGTDSIGNTVMDAQPGTIVELPMGMDFKAFNPMQPAQNYSDFIKTSLRAIASGLSISYNTLANDLENVNYSSIRAGVLEDREFYKALQTWLIESFVRPVFEEWLMFALTTNKLQGLPFSRYDKFNRPEFKPRRWSWVDPLKDIQAAELGIALRLTSRRSVIAEAGGDVETVFDDNLADEAYAESIGLSLETDTNAAQLPQQVDSGGIANGQQA